MATIDRRNTLIYGAGIKSPALVATTGGNIVLNGVQVVDGVTVGNNGERVLVKDQTLQIQNGIYIASTGPWTLAPDSATNSDWVTGTLVEVASGAVNGGAIFVQSCTDSPVVIGTSLISFVSLTVNLTALQSSPSSTSLTIGTGTQSLVVYGSRPFAVSTWVQIASSASPSNYMLGQVTSYNAVTGALVVNVTATGGSGTFAAWTVTLSGAPGAAGAAGAAGTQGPAGAAGGILTVLSRTITAQPGSPAAGASYLLPASTLSGAAWGAGGGATYQNYIATWSGSAWVFTAPTRGLVVMLADTGDNLVDHVIEYNGAIWQPLALSIDGTPEVSVASASTCDISNAASSRVLITGSTTITSFGTTQKKRAVLCRLAASLTITYNSTTLITANGKSILGNAGDVFLAVSDASGNWRITFYQFATGSESSRSRCRALTNTNERFTLSQTHALVMQDNTVLVCGASSDSLALGSNVQAVTTPLMIVLPAALMGNPVATVVNYTDLYILTDQGDVCVAGLNSAGQLGIGNSSACYVATLLNSTNITPRSSGGANRAVTSMCTSGAQSADATLNSVYFVCADNSLWACGYNPYGQLGCGSGDTKATITSNATTPTRCLKIANSNTQAVAQSTNSTSTVTPAVGAQNFGVAAAGPWTVNDYIYGYSNASIANWFFGQVTGYSVNTLTINILVVGTPVSAADWCLSSVISDASSVVAAGGSTGDAGYVNTSGKVLLAGRLGNGAAALCATGPGSGTGVANFPAFRLVKTNADDGSSALPSTYTCNKLIMAGTGQDIHAVALLAADSCLYMVGYNGSGNLGDGGTTSRANFLKAGNGTAAATALNGTVTNAWCVDDNSGAFLAQLSGGQVYTWGYGGHYAVPGSGGIATNATPVQAPAPFNSTSPTITKMSRGGYFGSQTVAALTSANTIYVWGEFAYQGGVAPATTSTPFLLVDPYGGAQTILDVMVFGWSNEVSLFVLYANGEVWGCNLNGATSGELGISSGAGPYSLVRMRL
jgi:Protein of unknown function (DUF2793)